MTEISPKEPITTKIPFSKKLALAARESRNVSRASRMRTKYRYKSVWSRIAINFTQILAVLAVSFMIAFITTDGHIINSFAHIFTTDQNNSSSTSTSVSTTNNSGGNAGVDGAQNDTQDEVQIESDLVVKVTDQILKDKGVSKFSDIADQNDLTSKIKQITEKSAGRIVVKLSSKYKDVSRPEVRELAKNLLLQLSANIPELTQVTVCTSENYFVEVANRAN